MKFKINKKNQLPIFKVIIILLTSSAIFISFIFFYFSSQDLNLNNNKAITQLTIKKILNSNCFSDKYGFIKEEKFNEKFLNLCFKNFDEQIYLKLKIKNLKNDKIIKEDIYLGVNKNNLEKKKEFEQKAKLCSGFSQISNQFCSSHLLPIIYLNSTNHEIGSILEINIII